MAKAKTEKAINIETILFNCMALRRIKLGDLIELCMFLLLI